MSKKKHEKMIVSKISIVPHDKKRAAHKNVLFVEGIPDSTKEDFKKVCRMKHLGKPRETMRDAIIKLMRLYVYAKGVPSVERLKGIAKF